MTSNESCGDRPSLFPEVVIAWAILDRRRHSTTISIRGGSYRLEGKRRDGLIQKPESA